MVIAALTLFVLPGGPDAPSSQESVKDLIRDLGAEDYDVRERATRKLLEKGKGAVSVLRAAARHTRDPEIRARSNAIIDRLVWVRAELSCERTTFELGQFSWPNVRLINETTRPLWLHPVELCLVQAPHEFRAWWEVIGPEGEPVEHSWDSGGSRVISDAGGFVEAAKLTDLVVLKPGEPWNPVQRKCASCIAVPSVLWRAWTPTSAGTYRIRFVYDDLSEWFLYPGLRDWLSDVRHERIVSNWVEITVTE